MPNILESFDASQMMWNFLIAVIIIAIPVAIAALVHTFAPLQSTPPPPSKEAYETASRIRNSEDTTNNEG